MQALLVSLIQDKLVDELRGLERGWQEVYCYEGGCYEYIHEISVRRTDIGPRRVVGHRWATQTDKATRP
jgi:hypothetical protein